MSWKCVSCGHENSDSSDFCDICGLARPRSGTNQGVKSDVHSSARESSGAKLKALIQVMGTDEIYSIVGQVNVGRALDNDIIVNDLRVSRRHARITLEGSDFAIEDLGTTNGTFVNGADIKGKGKVILKEGDEVELGETKFKFTLHVSE